MTRWGKRLVCVLMTAILAVFLFSNPVLAKSGCCSWHGGVAYCDTKVGRLVCNDGTYSPTCTCPISTPTNAPTPIPTKRPTPTPTPTPVPTLSPALTPTESPAPTPEVLGEEIGKPAGGGGWLALIFLLPLAVGSFFLIKRKG